MSLMEKLLLFIVGVVTDLFFLDGNILEAVICTSFALAGAILLFGRKGKENKIK